MKSLYEDTSSSLGLLILRLGIGGFLLTHGIGKLNMLLNGQFEMFGDPIGIGSVLSVVLVTISEFLCAILVMVGLGTRIASAVVVISMAVAAFVVHGADPWTMESAYKIFMAGESEFPVAKEPALLYLIPFLALVFTGGGRFALDAVLFSRRKAEGTESVDEKHHDTNDS